MTTLLQSCLIDFLSPDEKENAFPYYNQFLYQYTLTTVTVLVSQCSLMHETYEDATQESIDNDVDGMIAQLPKGARMKRGSYRTSCMITGLDPGKLVQDNENRIFVSDFFVKDAKKNHLSNRDMVMRGLNCSAFLSYFFLIEDTLKRIYIDICKPEEKFIGGSEVINVCLAGILSKTGIKKSFEKEFYARSKFFFDFRSLGLMWSLLNSIRNQISHSNGSYDEKAKKNFNKKFDLLIKHFLGKDELLESINLIANLIEDHEQQIKMNDRLVVGDDLENIIRNISIFLMESLYVCIRKKH